MANDVIAARSVADAPVVTAIDQRAGDRAVGGTANQAPLAVSADDMARYTEIVRSLQRNFSDLDANGDSQLTRLELRDTAGNEQASDERRQLAELFLRHFDEAAAMSHEDKERAAITRIDLEAMQVVTHPQEFEASMTRLRKSEVGWGIAQAVGGGIVGIAGAALTVASVYLLPASGGASYSAVGYGLIFTTIGGSTVQSAVKNLTDSDVPRLRENFAEQQRTMSTWHLSTSASPR